MASSRQAPISPPSTANGQERLHALDAVRGFALIAGILFHATMSFLPSPRGIPMWIVTDNHPSVALALTFHVLHIFRMATFFLIAGFFAHMMVERRGVGGFVRDRAKRIALPLLVAWPLVFGSIVAVTIWAYLSQPHAGPPPAAPTYPGFPAFPLTHLWFLYVLIWLYAATLVLRALVGAFDRAGRVGPAIDRVVKALVDNPAGFVVLAAPTALILVLDPTWLSWAGVPTPDSSLLPNAQAAVAFFTAFGFGWLVRRQTGLLQVWRRRWPVNLALGVALTAIEIVAAGGFLPNITPLPLGPAKIIVAAGYAMAIWTWTFGLIGAALRFLDGHSPLRRYIADASYWLYIVHLPLVMALQVVVSRLAWPWELKYAVILGVAFPLMFASYELLVRHTFIGSILNGRRYPWRAPRPAPLSHSPNTTSRGAAESAT
jgi:peptidoglycan/LPS O-acetylase OafA/YrhL